MEKFFDRLPGDNEVSTIAEILLADPPKLELLVAHGKGALVARSALEQYVDDLKGDESALFKRLRIITLGSVLELPAQFKAVKQYLGAFDWLGRARSSLGVEHERVPGAGHHLNPSFPYAMSVAALLNGGVQPRLLPKPPRVEPVDSVSIPRAAAQDPIPRKAKEPAPKPAKKVAKPSSSKVAAPAPKAASPAPKAEPKVAAAAKQQHDQVKGSNLTAKPVAALAPKKVEKAPSALARSSKPKIAAVIGKLVVKKSKKEGR